MPVVVIRLELKLGEVSLVVSVLTRPEVLLLILFQLLKIISTYTDALCTYRYRQLQQGMQWLQLEVWICTIAVVIVVHLC